MGFIKKLLGGLFAFLGGLAKLLGLGKKSEYFLEAEPIESIKDAAQSAVKTVMDAAEETTPPAKAPAPKVTAAEDSEASVVQAVAADLTDDLNGSKSSKTAAAAAAASKSVVKESSVATVKSSPETALDNTFAPKFLISSNTLSSRRRPGPSLSPFLDMAKQMKPQG
ncbi:MAG: hypothetical protein KME20_01860 [Kaiparowitsia implicata GSE-PSE-MK54-09C]|nr:hypothetical protein [Kaiparowitsia implicata GSE-PSE-MK54-09C]